MEKYADIFEYVTKQEADFGLPVQVLEGYEWSFKDHVKTSLFYKNGRLLTGNSPDKPVKNIVRPILNVQYRAEDIDVKDIHIYVDEAEKQHLSFLIKKYHDDVFVRENDLDSFFDECKEEKIDFGGTLIQRLPGARPETVRLQTIAFCDQANMLSAPIGIRLYFSLEELYAMEKYGWGKKENGASLTIDELAVLAESSKTQDKEYGKTDKTPGKYLEVYQVYGMLPSSFLRRDDQQNNENDKYVKQLHFITFVYDQNKNRIGVTLFQTRNVTERFKFHSRDNVYGRALGFGGVEELFESQVWTNYSMIAKKRMLDAASKIIIKTTDKAAAARNKISKMDNLEIISLEENTDMSQLDTYPRNYSVFDVWDKVWEEHGRTTGSATDPLLGEKPTSGTPFRLQERLVMEGKAIHEYRRGKFAKFIEEVYQDWIIPYIVSELRKGQKFMSELPADEFEWVIEKMTASQLDKWKVEETLAGRTFSEVEVAIQEQKISNNIRAQGNKRFFEILGDELKGVSLKVKVNVAGKQRDLAGTVDKLSNIFQQIISSINPQTGTSALDNPKVAKVFNKIIEYSGLNPIDFLNIKSTLSPFMPSPATALPTPSEAQ